VRSILLLGAAVVLIGAAAPAQRQEETSAAARADRTLAQMTPDDKIRLLHGPLPLLVAPAKRLPGVAIGAGYIQGDPLLGIPTLVESDASLGVSNLLDIRRGDVATALPSGLAMAASWDPGIAHAAGAMIGSEARAKGFNVMLVGGTNLVRDPRGGRSFEYLGEDPLLAGTLVAAQIAGVQSNHMIATIKHFALNDQETGRNVANVQLDESAMRESDLLAFELGIERGDPGSVMCAYNRVGGRFACENPFLLNQVLRHDWRFRGYVMSDWGAVHSTEAILAGLDQQSGEQLDGKRWFSDLLTAAVAAGRVPQAAVDRAARRVLYSVYRHGLEDDPVAARLIPYAADARVAQRAEEAGIVLLKNEGNLLPLVSKARKILVVGGNADAGVPSGGGSSQVTPVGGFKRTMKAGAGQPPFARRAYGGISPLDGIRSVFSQAAVSFIDGKDPATAVQAARSADVVILFADKFSTEGADQADLGLRDGQDELISAMADANPRTIVVLETGNPILMPWRSKVSAIVQAWYGGQNGGTAIARVLRGDVNPSGRLPVTFPASLEQLPNPVLPGTGVPPADKNVRASYGPQADKQPFDIHYPEGSDVGYRWYDRKNLKPLYSFGYGLSYSRFRYDALQVRSGKILSVSFRVTNTGRRAGADVPQVYVVRPGRAKRLIGWGKPMLAPGASKVVTVTADPRALADFDAKRQRWVVPAEAVRIEVARSATDPVLVREAWLHRRLIKP
jgi:beta-glucosidase